MRVFLVTVLCLVIAVFGLATIPAHQGTSDPCDSYGNCLSSLVVYTRSNPDLTLYMGDQFHISLTISLAPGSALEGVTWTYDHGVLAGNTTNTGGDFIAIGNVSGKYTVTISASFTSTTCSPVTTTNSSTASASATTATTSTTCTSSSTSLSTSQTVTLRGFVLEFSTSMLNVTDNYGNALRNPDGSFYRNDSFAVAWNATFLFSGSRDDILVNVTSVNPSNLLTVSVTSDRFGRNGTFLYQVRASSSYSPSQVTLQAEAFNWKGQLLGVRTSTQLFAVVQYSPYFKELTYVDYNSKNSSAYARPFVTLVRYDGNSPGYTYAGNANTGPFNAQNSTGERAMINDFTFATEGWNLTLDTGGLYPLNFTKYGNIPFQYASSSPPSAPGFTGWEVCGFGDHSVVLNCGATTTPVQPHVFTWGDRVMKWYFHTLVYEDPDDPIAPYFAKYTSTGTAYFNLTETAVSDQFAGGNYRLFNSTYLYEPILYNGNLTFTVLDSSGKPDPQVNITVTAYNPDPLDPYLVSRAVSVFGKDSEVLGLFDKDLYNASAVLEVLKPVILSPGVWQYTINQTNLEQDGDPPAAIQVTVQGHGHVFTYAFANAFSLYNVSIPTQVGKETVYWDNLTAYTMGQSVQFRSLPLAFNFSTPAPYEIWSGPPNGAGAFLPITEEPGGYSADYPFLYGSNNAVIVNLAGGGASQLSSVQGPTVQTTIFVDPPSGGAEEFWVREGNGTNGPLLFDALLPDNMDPPAPSGFEGSASFTWAPTQNGTVTIGIVNSFGVSVPIGYLQITLPAVSQPNFGYTFLWVFLAVCVVFVLLGRLINRGSRGEPEPEGSALALAVRSTPT